MSTPTVNSEGTGAASAGVKHISLAEDVYVAVPDTSGGGRRPWSVPIAALPVAGCAALLATVRLGATRPGLLAAALLPLLVVLAGIDLRSRVVPNKIVFPAFVAVLVFQLALAPGQAAEWLVAAVAAPLVMLMPAVFDRRAVGMGDVKLAAVLGAALGVQAMGAVLIGALAVVPVAAVALVRGGRAARRTAIPFVPFMALGAAVVLLG